MAAQGHAALSGRERVCAQAVCRPRRDLARCTVLYLPTWHGLYLPAKPRGPALGGRTPGPEATLTQAEHPHYGGPCNAFLTFNLS